MKKLEQDLLEAGRTYGDARAAMEACEGDAKSTQWATLVGAVRAAHARMISAARAYATNVRGKGRVEA